MIYRFDTLPSTNDTAQEPRFSHGDIIVAERQSAGRGQRGNKWLSGEGLNLTFSAVVCPTGLEAREQFRISQAAALALCDVLQSYSLRPTIKWTNDIYIGECKIAGILIENRLSGAMLARSVVGIGLNVNQTQFDESLPNPTSMMTESGEEYDRTQILDRIEQALQRRMEQIEQSSEREWEQDYHSLLYRRGECHKFRLPNGEPTLGTIVGVESTGHLVIQWAEGQRERYSFGEIDFIIERRKR